MLPTNTMSVPKKRFFSFIIFTFCYFLFFAGIVSGQGTQYTVTQLTSNSYYDRYPQIHCGQVAWQGYDGHDWEIFLYDGSKTIQLTNNNYNDRYPKIHNGQVTWQGSVQYWGWGDEIFLYDGSKTIQLTNNDYYDGWPQIHNGHVAWHGYVGPSEIFLYDGTQTIQLTNNDYGEGWLQIHNGQVVWHAYDGHNYEIFLYDGTQTIQLSNTNFENRNPQIHNGQVAWHGYDGHDWEIFFYNGTRTRRLTNNKYNDCQPQIHNGQVAWHVYGDHVWGIFLYDGRKTIKLTNNDYPDWYPQIHNGQVVWYGSDGHDWEIFLYDDTQTIQLTNNDYDDYGPQIHNGQVVWYGYDGHDLEIFLATVGKEFMVTFDDGPLLGKTDKVVGALEDFYVGDEPVKAGFFMVGDDPDFPLELDYYAPSEIWRDKGSVKQNHALVQMVAQNHLIGNHTQHHAWFGWWWPWDYEPVKDEISACDWEISSALAPIDKTPDKIFRPPYLFNSQGVRDGARDLGYEIIWGEVADVWPSALKKTHPFIPEQRVVGLVKWYAEQILKSWDEDEPRVLIFHDVLPVTHKHIGKIIEHLQNEGFTLTQFDPERLDIQKTESKPALSGAALCPVDLNIIDPDGLILNKQANQIPRAVYEEVDISGNGSVDCFFIPESKIGDYLIEVIPEPDALPEDTYSVGVGRGEDFIVLAENTPISEIPEEPYLIRLTEEGIEMIRAAVRIEPETLNLASRGVFTAFINLPEGYEVAAIDVSTVVCEGARAVEGMVSQKDSGTYIAKFNTEDLANVPTGDAVTLRLRGKVLDNGYLVHFEGSDTIRVID